MSTKQKKTVYLDNAAATHTDEQVHSAMQPYLTEKYANPSGPYTAAREQRETIESARAGVAKILGAASPQSIIFTSGGTESDNLALFGVCEKHQQHGKHIITTHIEHHAVLRPAEKLEAQGYEVTYVGVDSIGRISLKELEGALKPETILVSAMYANNELGTVQPIGEVSRLLAKWRKKNNTEYPYFHTDACQAPGFLPLAIGGLGVDLMTLNGSKIYGPKGVGVLYKREGVEIVPHILGGGQEMGMRSGTENVAALVGMGVALEHAHIQGEKRAKNIRVVRDYFWEELQGAIENVTLNGAPLDEARLPNNLHVRFEGVDADLLIAYVDTFGIMCAAGSACSTTSSESSHVLAACGFSDVHAQESIRFTLGKDTSREDIDYTVDVLVRAVQSLRRI